MFYLRYEIKNLYRSRIIRLMIIFLFIIAIATPISTYITYLKNENFGNEGLNPFQYWLLNYSAGWGGPTYFRLFYIFPVISTGMVYFQESSSSIREIILTKIGYKNYFIVKLLSVSILSFCAFSLFFMCNSICTHICFHGREMTSFYKEIVPISGSFADIFYKISPLFMEVMYGLINALAQAFLTGMVVGLQMSMRTKNKYAAFIGPFFIMYIFDYMCQIIAVSCIGKPYLCLSLIVQPSMCWAMVDPPKIVDLFFVFGGTLLLLWLLTVVGFFRNRDNLR